jgi:hypothetical protein
MNEEYRMQIQAEEGFVMFAVAPIVPNDEL